LGNLAYWNVAESRLEVAAGSGINYCGHFMTGGTAAVHKLKLAAPSPNT
jgi:hypothetical protein